MLLFVFLQNQTQSYIRKKDNNKKYCSLVIDLAEYNQIGLM